MSIVLHIGISYSPQKQDAFKTYFPKMHEYYQSTMLKIKQSDPSFKSPFVDTFPSAAFNLGLQIICKPHRDFKNLAFGICAIMALGAFDAEEGGHLVLDELHLVIEFPPGSTALISFVVVTHLNTRVRLGEKRFSFIQYASGTIFLYVKNGMQTDKTVLRNVTDEEKPLWKILRSTRWEKGLAMFPMLCSYE